jgi:hypothetical protein
MSVLSLYLSFVVWLMLLVELVDTRTLDRSGDCRIDLFVRGFYSSRSEGSTSRIEISGSFRKSRRMDGSQASSR